MAKPRTSLTIAHTGGHTRLARAAVLVAVAIVAIAFFIAKPAGAQHPQPGQDPQAAYDQMAAKARLAGLVTPNDAGTGVLLLKADTDGFYVQAPIVKTDVTIDVTGPIARAKVTQRFENLTDKWVEGVYVFPLPDNSAVDALKMQIGDRFIEGKVKERQEARQIYEEAKAQGFKAGLIEQERPNLFTNSVANIGPGETVVVQIEYQEALKIERGQVSMRFPLVVAPRYNPEPEIVQTVTFNERGLGVTTNANDPVPDRERIEPPVLDPRKMPEGLVHNPVVLTVNLRAGFDLASVTSATHEIIERRSGNEAATVTLAEGEVPADKDFELVWTPKPGSEPTAALFKERQGDEDYLLLMVVPPSGEQATTRLPREAIFVIDNSGSMSGPSMQQAKASLLQALGTLTPNDTFNVIRFDDTTEVFFPRPVPATPDNLEQARAFVSKLEANGGTEMLPAMRAALTDYTPGDASRLRQIIFLTDAAIGNEAEIFKAISEGLGRSRLFTIGIGSAPNSYFMSRASRLGRGTFTSIGDINQVTERMAGLIEKLERPVMTNLAADWPAAARAEAWPNPIPDLYAGEPVVLTAKMPEAKGEVVLTGLIGDRPWRASVPIAQGAEGDGVEKLWARRKIDAIEESYYEGVPYDEVDKRVLAVALEHHLVSRLTSLVAVDVTPTRPEGTPLASADVPLNLPEGWDFEKVFGSDAQQRAQQLREAAANGAFQLAALKPKAPPGAPQVDPETGLPLPMGSTPAALLVLIGGLLVMIGGGWLMLAARRRPMV